MNNYQIVFIIKSDKPSQEQAKKVAKLITELKGKIKKENFLGKKTMAYSIKGIKEGDYYQLYFDFSPEKIPQLKKEMIQKELVLRFLILKDEDKTNKKPVVRKN